MLEDYIGDARSVRKADKKRKCKSQRCRTTLCTYNTNDFCFVCLEKRRGKNIIVKPEKVKSSTARRRAYIRWRRTRGLKVYTKQRTWKKPKE